MMNIYIRDTFSRNRNRNAPYYRCIMGIVINRIHSRKPYTVTADRIVSGQWWAPVIIIIIIIIIIQFL